VTDSIAVYASAPSTRIDPRAAASFLHVWLDTVLNTPLAVPAYCPRCRATAATVAVGRSEPSWFQIAPCGCLFEIGTP
jgi:hypothetical protein